MRIALGRQSGYAWGIEARWIVLPVLFLAGCGAHPPTPYQDDQGFTIIPPPGWVLRARDDAMPTHAGHKDNTPLPSLAGPGKVGRERLLARYDRVTAGQLAWLRVSVADVPSSTPLKKSLAAHAPGPDWKQDGEMEDLEVGKLPAARAAFLGRWTGQDYISETFAVRQGEQVYFITASFPASDSTAREQVKRAVDGASWQ